jgi:hypothetical protein
MKKWTLGVLFVLMASCSTQPTAPDNNAELETTVEKPIVKTDDSVGKTADDDSAVKATDGDSATATTTTQPPANSSFTGLTKPDAWEVISKNTGPIQTCYENELVNAPGLAGKLTFTWIVNADGSVGDVTETASTFADSALSKCVAGEISKMKFPAKDKATEIVFPWIFKSG